MGWAEVPPGECSVKTAAIFDLDGTILDRSSERVFFLYLLTHREVNLIDLLTWTRYFVKTAYVVDYTQATKANKMYLRNKPCAKMRQLVSNCFSEKLVGHISRDAIAEIECHRRGGRYLTLLSGTLDFLLEHFMRHLDMDCMIGTSVEMQDDVFTGRVSGLHPFGEAKALITRQIADQHEIDLSESYGYANSFSDVPFLNTVGYPIAVNPDSQLSQYAKEHNWEIMSFTR